jgi:lysyl-tRNA synthetase class 2
MLRTVVSSASLSSVGYDRRMRALEVEFRSGRIYLYLDVPKPVYDGLRTAASKGRYFNERVRDAFDAVRLQ